MIKVDNNGLELKQGPGAQSCDKKPYTSPLLAALHSQTNINSHKHVLDAHEYPPTPHCLCSGGVLS